MLLLLLALFGWTAAARAQSAAEFLRIGLGARALSLGSAAQAAEDDPSAVFWNPAFLGFSPRRGAEAMHAENFGGAAGFDALSVSLPVGRPGEEAIGIALLRLAVDDIPTTNNFRFEDVGADGRPGTHDAGEGDGRWDPGEPVDVDPSAVVLRSDEEWALVLGYGRALGRGSSAGVAAKYLRQRVDDHQSSGFGVDAGARLALARGFSLSARLVDAAGTHISWDNGARERIAPRLELGLSRTVSLGARGTVRALASAGSGAWDGARGAREWHAGAEYSPCPRLHLRGGSANGEPAFGAGVGIPGFRFDYATMPFHELGATHRLSAVARW